MLTVDEETTILDMNTIIMSELKEKDENNNFKKSSLLNNNDLNIGKCESAEIVNQLNSNLMKAKKSRDFLNKLQSEIDESDLKLKMILQNRDTLSNILKDFNTQTKEITQDKEKIVRLKDSIQKIYKKYEITRSIEAFFENTLEECVEKMRFISDYEEIENGINFFTLNTTYVDANSYLNTYNMLKRIALNRYYNYMSTSLAPLQKGQGIKIDDNFCNFVLSYGPENVKKAYYGFPRNYEKVKEVQIFFDKRSKYDYEVKMSLNSVKNKFIDGRSNLLKVFYEEILHKYEPYEKNLNFILGEVSYLSFCEIVYFITLFQTKPNENNSSLQTLIIPLYESLYNTIRPIIINSENLDFLTSLFDSFSEYFSVYFVDSNSENNLQTEEKLVHYFFSQRNDFNPENIKIIKDHLDTFIDLLTLSKNIIRPTILKLVQDIQEKVYFKINNQIKNAFIYLEDDLPSISFYEEKMSESKSNFNLYHFFLRRMAIIFTLLKNKLDKTVSDELTIICIEKFVTILNEEILKEKQLTYNFELYVIQQILLVINILEDFEVNTVSVATEVDFYSLSDIFTKDYLSIVNWAPKFYEKTRDFKKILYNNLLKGYKMLNNLVNEYLLGREIMDIVYKIRNKDLINSNLLELRIKKEPFMELYDKFEKILNELKNRIGVINRSICEKICNTILENLENIISSLRSELLKNNCVAGEFEIILNICGKEDQDQIIYNLKNIKLSIFS